MNWRIREGECEGSARMGVGRRALGATEAEWGREGVAPFRVVRRRSGRLRCGGGPLRKPRRGRSGMGLESVDGSRACGALCTVRFALCSAAAEGLQSRGGEPCDISVQ